MTNVSDGEHGWVSGSMGTSDVPNQRDPHDENPIITYVAEALRCFGADLSREDATMLLPYWRHASELTAREVAMVLDRFAPEPVVPEHEGYRLGGRQPRK